MHWVLVFCVKTEGGVCVVGCRHYEFVNILHWVCVFLYESGFCVL
jgi:metal-dependent hydrolase (beta-lactamase superfamily II)